MLEGTEENSVSPIWDLDRQINDFFTHFGLPNKLTCDLPDLDYPFYDAMHLITPQNVTLCDLVNEDSSTQAVALRTHSRVHSNGGRISIDVSNEVKLLASFNHPNVARSGH